MVFASCPIPGSSRLAVGSGGKALGEALARWDTPAPAPCPPTCTLRPNFYLYFALWGRQGCSRSPGDAGHSARLCGLRSLCDSRVGKPDRNRPANTCVAVGSSSPILWVFGDFTCVPAPRGASLDPPGSIPGSPGEPRLFNPFW